MHNPYSQSDSSPGPHTVFRFINPRFVVSVTVAPALRVEQARLAEGRPVPQSRQLFFIRPCSHIDSPLHGMHLLNLVVSWSPQKESPHLCVRGSSFRTRHRPVGPSFMRVHTSRRPWPVSLKYLGLYPRGTLIPAAFTGRAWTETNTILKARLH